MREQKVLGFLLAIGLCVVAGIFWVLDDEKDVSEDPEASTVAVESPEDAATTGAVSDEPAPEITGEPVGEEMAGKVLLSTRPVQVLSAPSESASAMFGFPAGRPFRAISKKDGFVRIQDVRSGASGWIEEAALKPAPPPKPVVAAPSSTPRRNATSSGGARPRPAPDTATAAAEPEPAPQRKRRGLFGGGGFLGGLFGGR
jgi:hypothetical protein